MTQLDQIQQRISPELDRMNAIINATLTSDNEMMNNIVRSYLATKGKQIRPILVILSAKLLGEVNSDVLHAGAALEMLHNASLIHDDIVDETALRRGIPTINSRWGNHIAVLIGDFFVSNALHAGIKTGHISIIASLSNLGKELSVGEIDQICNAREHHFDENKYFSVIRKKTASLFMNCVRMGGEAAHADERNIALIEQYAELLGLCFQIKDDIFDYFPNRNLGKPTGNDLREGKVTLPLLYALNHAPAARAEKMKAVIRDNDLLTSEMINELIEFAITEGGIDYSFEIMREMQKKADRILDSFPDSEWKRCFREIFEFIISRDR